MWQLMPLAFVGMPLSALHHDDAGERWQNRRLFGCFMIMEITDTFRGRSATCHMVVR